MYPSVLNSVVPQRFFSLPRSEIKLVDHSCVSCKHITNAQLRTTSQQCQSHNQCTRIMKQNTHLTDSYRFHNLRPRFLGLQHLTTKSFMIWSGKWLFPPFWQGCFFNHTFPSVRGTPVNWESLWGCSGLWQIAPAAKWRNPSSGIRGPQPCLPCKMRAVITLSV